MINKPSLITHEGLRFLIMDSPSRENAESYANQLLSIGVVDLVRTCKVNYEESIFELKGIRIHVIHKQNLYFQDGSVPPRKKDSNVAIMNTYFYQTLETMENTKWDVDKLKRILKKAGLDPFFSKSYIIIPININSSH